MVLETLMVTTGGGEGGLGTAALAAPPSRRRSRNNMLYVYMKRRPRLWFKINDFSLSLAVRKRFGLHNADRQIHVLSRLLVVLSSTAHRRPRAATRRRAPPPAATPRLRVRVRMRARRKKIQSFQLFVGKFLPQWRMLHAGCPVRTSWVPQRTPALDEATVVWSVWRSPHPKYLSKAVRRWLAPVRV